MKYLIFSLAILGIGCGKSGSNTQPTTAIPGQSNGSTYQQTISANSGQVNGTSYTVSQPGYVLTPVYTQVNISQDQSEFYHVMVTIGSVSCDFTHAVNSNTTTSGACSGGQSQISMNVGDVINITIPPNGMMNIASASLVLTLHAN